MDNPCPIVIKNADYSRALPSVLEKKGELNK
jgi:hypothetical protein